MRRFGRPLLAAAVVQRETGTSRALSKASTRSIASIRDVLALGRFRGVGATLLARGLLNQGAELDVETGGDLGDGLIAELAEQ